VLIGRQLTDVVETANASSSTNRTFFPLAISWRAYARPGSPGAVFAKQQKIPSTQNRVQKRCWP
jgi:hypothetical protein